MVVRDRLLNVAVTSLKVFTSKVGYCSWWPGVSISTGKIPAGGSVS